MRFFFVANTPPAEVPGAVIGCYKLLEKVRDYHLPTSGPEHPETLGAMSNLATSYNRTGRYLSGEAGRAKRPAGPEV